MSAPKPRCPRTLSISSARSVYLGSRYSPQPPSYPRGDPFRTQASRRLTCYIRKASSKVCSEESCWGVASAISVPVAAPRASISTFHLHLPLATNSDKKNLPIPVIRGGPSKSQAPSTLGLRRRRAHGCCHHGCLEYLLSSLAGWKNYGT